MRALQNGPQAKARGLLRVLLVWHHSLSSGTTGRFVLRPLICQRQLHALGSSEQVLPGGCLTPTGLLAQKVGDTQLLDEPAQAGNCASGSPAKRATAFLVK
jgi:hypothetical protein